MNAVNGIWQGNDTNTKKKLHTKKFIQLSNKTKLSISKEKCVKKHRVLIIMMILEIQKKNYFMNIIIIISNEPK